MVCYAMLDVEIGRASVVEIQAVQTMSLHAVSKNSQFSTLSAPCCPVFLVRALTTDGWEAGAAGTSP